MSSSGFESVFDIIASLQGCAAMGFSLLLRPHADFVVTPNWYVNGSACDV